MLSFAQNKVVVNMGVLQDDKIKISKKAVPVKFDTLYSENDPVYKEFKYTPNLGRPISIIDPIYHVPIDVQSYGNLSLQICLLFRRRHL